MVKLSMGGLDRAEPLSSTSEPRRTALLQFKGMIRDKTTWVRNLFKRELSLILPYSPMDSSRELLDAEYSSGLWDCLGDLDELSRFSVISGYCHHLKDQAAILEVGCGEGLLQKRLDDSKYSRYVGVDISTVAISRASQRQDHKNLFIVEDARTYSADQQFDVIIFSECLEYFADPLGLVKRYQCFLHNRGIFIISMFVGLDTARTKLIWRMLDSVYKPTAETTLSNGNGYTWIIKVFSPTVIETHKLIST